MVDEVGPLTEAVLVASVGKSPVPVALSILTIRPSVVALVCSKTTKAEATRIEAVVHPKLPGTRFEILQVEDEAVRDFGRLRTSLASLDAMVGPGQDFLLAYTGGTAAMVSTLVEYHYCHHGGDRPDLRFYVDLDNSRLRRDQGTKADPATAYRLSHDLCLVERARLGGFELSGRRRTLSRPLPPLDEVIGWRGLIYDENGQSINPLPTEFTTAVQDFNSAFGPVEHSSEAGRRAWESRDTSIASGAWAECVIGAVVADLHDGLLAEGGCEPGEVELLLGGKPSTGGHGQHVDADVLFRYKNLVWIIEAKNTDNTDTTTLRLQDFLSCARGLMRGSEVFGAATKFHFWALTSSKGKYGDEFRSLMRVVQSVLSSQRTDFYIPASRPKTDLEALNRKCLEQREKFRNKIQTYRSECGKPARYPGHQAQTVDDGSRPVPWQALDVSLSSTLLSGTGGSALAIYSTQALAGFAPHLFGPADSVRDHKKHLVLIDKDKVSEEDMYKYATLKTKLGRYLAEDAAGGPVGLYLTPSTKAVTAAMTVTGLQARERGTAVDLLVHQPGTNTFAGISGALYPVRDTPLDWPAYVEELLAQPGQNSVPAAAYSPWEPGTDSSPAQTGSPRFDIEAFVARAVDTGYSVLARNDQVLPRIAKMYPLFVVAGRNRVVTIMDPALLPTRGETGDKAAASRHKVRGLHEFVTAGMFGEAARPVLFYVGDTPPTPEHTSLGPPLPVRAGIRDGAWDERQWQTAPDLLNTAWGQVQDFLGTAPETTRTLAGLEETHE